MLKITKPFRYANIVKGSLEGLNDKEYIKHLKKESKHLRYIPKNTLKARLKECRLFTQNADDFRYNKFTIRTVYEIIKFKR